MKMEKLSGKINNKKILLVSGCSWSDLKFHSIFHPSMDCSWTKWPEILADKLNMDCINLSHSGAGQEYIYYTLIEKIMSMNKDDIGLIIPGWSRAPRRDYQDFDKKFIWTNERWDARGDMRYFIERSLRHYFNFQIFCERFNLPYKQVQMIELFERPVFREDRINGIISRETALKSMMNSLYFKLIDEKNFIGWPLETKIGGYSMWDKLDQDKHFISEQDRHPNAEGQKIIAETIYENL